MTRLRQDEPRLPPELLLGRSGSTNRDHLIYCGSDGAVMSGKWKNIKVVFRAVRTGIRDLAHQHDHYLHRLGILPVREQT